MEKFTLSQGKRLTCYKLDGEKNLLYITVRQRQKVVWTQNVDLHYVYPDFHESVPEKLPIFKLIIAYIVLVINVFLIIAAIFFLAKAGKLFSLLTVGALIFPLGIAGYCWDLIQYWRDDKTGEFGFDADTDEDVFEIYYLPENRQAANEFACKVSQYCGGEQSS